MLAGQWRTYVRVAETLSDYIEILSRIYLTSCYVNVDFLRSLFVVGDDVQIVCCQTQESIDFIWRVGT